MKATFADDITMPETHLASVPEPGVRARELAAARAAIRSGLGVSALRGDAIRTATARAASAASSTEDANGTEQPADVVVPAPTRCPRFQVHGFRGTEATTR